VEVWRAGPHGGDEGGGGVTVARSQRQLVEQHAAACADNASGLRTSEKWGHQ
jgi:hypothetical protein